MLGVEPVTKQDLCQWIVFGSVDGVWRCVLLFVSFFDEDVVSYKPTLSIISKSDPSVVVSKWMRISTVVCGVFKIV